MYIENPKSKGSGIVSCIPQTGQCPHNCADCFFQSGRSYLEPLEANLPNIPEHVEDWQVVRMNDGNDSNVDRDRVLDVASRYKHVFFNTSVPELDFPGPVVLTVNPGAMTDTRFVGLETVPANLMFVRFRLNMWNLKIADQAVEHYAVGHGVPVVMTWMAYYVNPVPVQYRSHYERRTRTLNKYWCIQDGSRDLVERAWADNPLVHTCGYKGTHQCRYCGTCLREYHATRERMKDVGE